MIRVTFGKEEFDVDGVVEITFSPDIGEPVDGYSSDHFSKPPEPAATIAFPEELYRQIVNRIFFREATK